MRSLLSRYMLEALPEPVLVFDASGALVRANRCAHQSLSAEALGAFHPDGRTPAVRAFLEELARSGRAALELECGREGGSGAPQHLALDGFAVERHCVVRVRDVTEQRVLGRELAQLRRGATSGLVAAMVMHDFNNLLTPILDWTARLSRELERGSSAGLLAADIEVLAERATCLVRDTLSLTADQGGSRAAAFDLNQAIEQMRPLIERLFPANVEVELALDDAVGSVRIERSGLEQALVNLLVNARDALRPRSGQVVVSTRLVPAEHAEAPCFVSLAVSDTGCGMTDEVRARAFEEYFTTSDGGTGLGLASVRRFARESGGAVTLDSAPARGTTVTVLLPRETERACS